MKTKHHPTLPSLTRQLIIGFGSALDIGATGTTSIYNRLRSRSDYDAIASDWKAVGQAINDSIGIITTNNKPSPKNDQQHKS